MRGRGSPTRYRVGASGVPSVVLRSRVVAALTLILVLACGSVPRPGASSPPSPRFVPADLKYDLLQRLGPALYCDPDVYPVGRILTDPDVRARLATIASRDPATYRAILRHHGLGGKELSPADARTVYQDFKDLTAVDLAADQGTYHFDYIIQTPGGTSRSGMRVTGVIDRPGDITVESRTPQTLNCPICLAHGTLVATPRGDVTVEALRPGMAVWSQDATGARVAEVVLITGSTPVPGSHQVVHLVLADGRQVRVSPGHPTIDNRPVGDLVPGDRYDGATVISVQRERYATGLTYDLLPSGPTGVYWAGGIPLKSTLADSAG